MDQNASFHVRVWHDLVNNVEQIRMNGVGDNAGDIVRWREFLAARTETTIINPFWTSPSDPCDDSLVHLCIKTRQSDGIYWLIYKSITECGACNYMSPKNSDGMSPLVLALSSFNCEAVIILLDLSKTIKAFNITTRLLDVNFDDTDTLILEKMSLCLEHMYGADHVMQGRCIDEIMNHVKKSIDKSSSLLPGSSFYNEKLFEYTTITTSDWLDTFKRGLEIFFTLFGRFDSLYTNEATDYFAEQPVVLTDAFCKYQKVESVSIPEVFPEVDQNNEAAITLKPSFYNENRLDVGGPMFGLFITKNNLGNNQNNSIIYATDNTFYPVRNANVNAVPPPPLTPGIDLANGNKAFKHSLVSQILDCLCISAACRNWHYFIDAFHVLCSTWGTETFPAGTSTGSKFKRLVLTYGITISGKRTTLLEILSKRSDEFMPAIILFVLSDEMCDVYALRVSKALLLIYYLSRNAQSRPGLHPLGLENFPNVTLKDTIQRLVPLPVGFPTRGIHDTNDMGLLIGLISIPFAGWSMTQNQTFIRNALFSFINNENEDVLKRVFWNEDLPLFDQSGVANNEFVLKDLFANIMSMDGIKHELPIIFNQHKTHIPGYLMIRADVDPVTRSPAVARKEFKKALAGGKVSIDDLFLPRFEGLNLTMECANEKVIDFTFLKFGEGRGVYCPAIIYNLIQNRMINPETIQATVTHLQTLKQAINPVRPVTASAVAASVSNGFGKLTSFFGVRTASAVVQPPVIRENGALKRTAAELTEDEDDITSKGSSSKRIVNKQDASVEESLKESMKRLGTFIEIQRHDDFATFREKIVMFKAIFDGELYQTVENKAVRILGRDDLSDYYPFANAPDYKTILHLLAELPSAGMNYIDPEIIIMPATATTTITTQPRNIILETLKMIAASVIGRDAIMSQDRNKNTFLHTLLSKPRDDPYVRGGILAVFDYLLELAKSDKDSYTKDIFKIRNSSSDSVLMIIMRNQREHHLIIQKYKSTFSNTEWFLTEKQGPETLTPFEYVNCISLHEEDQDPIFH